MTSPSEPIPLVDFSPLSLDVPEDSLQEPENVAGGQQPLQGLSDSIVEVFSTVGFVYLKNTGFPFRMIDEVNQLAAKFFDEPESVKTQYKFAKEDNHGWVKMEQESVNTERPGDLKECFNVVYHAINDQRLPPELNTRLIRNLYELCTRLSHRILLAIAIGLRHPDPQVFIHYHNTFTRPTGTMMRLLCYPALPEEVKPNQVRLGEHTDYGTLTLLFQDQIGGLQVCNRDGEWIDATPIPDTILVNIADLMQRWTSDKLLSTPHRVLNPVDDRKKKTRRQSIAYFFHPDSDALVTCIDGSNKYEPIIADDHLFARLRATYHAY